MPRRTSFKDEAEFKEFAEAEPMVCPCGQPLTLYYIKSCEKWILGAVKCGKACSPFVSAHSLDTVMRTFRRLRQRGETARRVGKSRDGFRKSSKNLFTGV